MTEALAMVEVEEDRGCVSQPIPSAVRQVEVPPTAMEVESEADFQLKVRRRERGLERARQVWATAPSLDDWVAENCPGAAGGGGSPPSASRR